MPKRLGSAVLYAGYLLVTVGALLYAFAWLRFERELRARHPPDPAALAATRNVGAGTLRQLGSLAAKRPNSFVHFERDKPPGVVRACAIGDSFTYGDEVLPGQDYPALLQQLLHERGLDHVEVVNFGSNWHGFHQSYLLWDAVGRDFGCDYLLLGPASFQSKRDTEFNHTELARPYYLHARYVLEGEDLRRVDVLGGSHDERFSEYFRFLPRWRYLRYDRNPPPLLRALIPRHRTLANPFYYHAGGADEEAHASYRILLRRMADSGAQLVLLHRWPAIVALAEELALENLVAAHGFDQDRFPYRAPRGHNSAWANRVLAAQFMAHLVEDPQLSVPVLVADPPTPSPEPLGMLPIALSEYASVELTLGGAPFGAFAVASRDPLRASGGGPTGFAGGPARALLAIRDPRIPLPDAAFAPLASVPAAGASVSLQVGDGATPRVYPLGRVRALSPGGPILVADVEGFELAGRRELVFHGSRAFDLRAPELRDRRVRLLIDGTPALLGFPAGDRMLFYPLRGPLYQLAPDAEGYREIGALPARAELALTLQHAEHGIRELPLATLRQRSVPLALAASPLPRRIGRSEAPRRLTSRLGANAAPDE